MAKMQPGHGAQTALAANRLIGQGLSLEQVNAYLRSTPMEQIKRENLDQLEKDQGLPSSRPKTSS